MVFRRMLGNIIAYAISLILPKVAKHRRYFNLWERKGFHIMPINLYQPIPDTRTLKDELWNRESELVSINMNTEKQLELLTYLKILAD